MVFMLTDVVKWLELSEFYDLQKITGIVGL